MTKFFSILVTLSTTVICFLHGKQPSPCFISISFEPARPHPTELLVLKCEYDENQVRDNKHRGKFTIGRETTYIVGPIDKDGYIDYTAALNERLRQGVTKANNSNIVLLQALGPRPAGISLPPEY